MHRLILGLDYGDKRIVDHINGNGLDNRRCNLRICDTTQNGANKKSALSKHGFKGISRLGKRWYSKITHDGHLIKLGWFSTAREAALAYDAAAEKYHGEFAATNRSLGLLDEYEIRINIKDYPATTITI